MDKEKLARRLMATFLGELEEHVRALNRDLLALEKDPGASERAECFKTLFRTAHSLKGAARSVNVGLIESTCHQLEDILGAARDGRAALDPDLFALLFAAADAIEEAGMRLREQQDLAGAPLAALLARLEAAAGTVPVPCAAQPPPAATSQPPRPRRAEPPACLADAGPADSPLVSAPPPAVEAPADSSGRSSWMRVAAEKLDALLRGSGEMLVARRRVRTRVTELAALRESVAHWKAEWRGLEKSLAPILRARDGRPADGSPPVASAVGRLPLGPEAVRVLGQSGEHLRALEKELERLVAGLTADERQLDQAAGIVHEEVHRVRMLPFAEACQGLERAVRDLARPAGKEVDLVVEGGDVELDRTVLDGLKDPLLHLVRNAVDHGIEPADQRRQAGKPPRARVTVKAALRGSQVAMTVADDGRGINIGALREQVRKKKLHEPADEADLLRVIFLPGFSTARIITDVSGRGVGLDVVKSRVEALHGTVDLSSAAGQGTRFTLVVPLTLTTLRAVLVQAGGQVFAFAGTNVNKLERVAPGGLRRVAGREMLALGGPPISVAPLADILGLAGSEPARPADKLSLVIVVAGERQMAFAVDEFLAEQEVVVKALGPRIRSLRHVLGATILPSGQIALVLNAANVMRTALSRMPGPALAAPKAGAEPAARKRLLVVDDSLTTRTLEKSILEAAGYEVATAADGVAGWQLLQEKGADLVVSDVDMPRMDGIALTAKVRGSRRFQSLPVVLVTARESDEDKARGIEVGADAYLIKSAFEQKNLLEVIRQLL
jgi:two-component system chemotaxis sensor kinase CheA